MSYARFFLMIGTSMLAMYALTYANVWDAGHIWYSESRLYMVLYMGAVMAVIMLGFMWSMYEGLAAKVAVIAGSVAVFAVGLFLMRSQALIEDVAWMKAMIPHHSIAILTSERASISDPRVAELAQEIIDAQKREIVEMERLIADLEGGDS